MMWPIGCMVWVIEMADSSRPIFRIRILIDIAMTAALMFLMTYELIGETAHEVLGVCMVLLFLMHHLLNRNWTKHLFQGRYTPFRFVQTTLVLLLLLGMAGSAVSGVILSKHLFSALSIRQGQSWARTLHMLCGYWNFVLMSLHLGLHWNQMLAVAKRHLHGSHRWAPVVAHIAALAISCYGIHAFFKRELGSYLLLKNQFVFFDFEEPLVFFLLDYLAVMGLFVCIGHSLASGLLSLNRKHISVSKPNR